MRAAASPVPSRVPSPLPLVSWLCVDVDHRMMLSIGHLGPRAAPRRTPAPPPPWRLWMPTAAREQVRVYGLVEHEDQRIHSASVT